ncbi:MAG: hypothetical protein KAR17_01185, partial [Cyclobacteriaceae bacterium]|nr:hypothetical protein [Cyclobacteriaceae bacterium]
AVKSGDWKKAKQLYHKFEKQESFFFKEDYIHLSKLLKKMGLPKEAKKYDELAKQTVDSTVFSN